MRACGTLGHGHAARRWNVDVGGKHRARGERKSLSKRHDAPLWFAISTRLADGTILDALVCLAGGLPVWRAFGSQKRCLHSGGEVSGRHELSVYAVFGISVVSYLFLHRTDLSVGAPLYGGAGALRRDRADLSERISHRIPCAVCSRAVSRLAFDIERSGPVLPLTFLF